MSTKRQIIIHYETYVSSFLLKVNSCKCNGCFSPHVRESKTVLDSGFHAVDSGFQLLDSRSYTVELGFRIPIVRGIPDSDSCIPDSKAQDSGFHKQKFPRFRILHAKISRIPESGFPYMGRCFVNHDGKWLRSLGLCQLCSATFQQLLAFGATRSSNRE